MKAVVAAFNQEKALVGAFSVITNLRMELFLVHTVQDSTGYSTGAGADVPQHGAHSLHPLHHQAEGRRGRGHGHRQPQPQGGDSQLVLLFFLLWQVYLTKVNKHISSITERADSQLHCQLIVHIILCMLTDSSGITATRCTGPTGHRSWHRTIK